jgi:hypothetical protein
MKKLLLSFLLCLLGTAAHGAYDPAAGLINTYTLQGCGCGEDDTAEIIAAIANVATTVIVPVGVWTISQPITITASNSSGNTWVGVDMWGSIIRAKAGSNTNAMFSYNTSGNLAPFTMQNMTLDANTTNQTSGNNRVFNFIGAGAQNDVVFQQNVIMNCGQQCLVWSSSGLATNVMIRENLFLTSQLNDLYLGHMKDVHIIGNTFSNYNASASNSSASAIEEVVPNGAVSNVEIANNIFLPLASIEFSVECVPAASTPCVGFNMHDNFCDANLLGGCGWSGAFDNSKVTGNIIVHNIAGDRGGCECAGNNLLIANNVGFSNISLVTNSTAYPTVNPSGAKVLGNSIFYAPATATTGWTGIAVANESNVIVADNTIQVNFPSGSLSNTGILLGTYAGRQAIGPVVEVARNKVIDLSAQAAGLIAFYIADTSSSGMTIENNTCTSGYAVAALHYNDTGHTTADTDLTIRNNDWSACPTPYAGTPPTGTGVILGPDKTALDTQWSQPGGLPAIASGFGTTPSISAGISPAAFSVNVGSGGTASAGVITMPQAITGWNCKVTPHGAPQAAAVTYSAPTSATSITLTNYTLTTGVALNWTASIVLDLNCVAY